MRIEEIQQFIGKYVSVYVNSGHYFNGDLTSVNALTGTMELRDDDVGLVDKVAMILINRDHLVAISELVKRE